MASNSRDPWPVEGELPGDTPLLERIDAAFAGVDRPEHFTDHRHCSECAEHDETLRSHDRHSLGQRHVGNPSWDPLCFCSAQGQAYYLPALARFALAPPDPQYGWYGEQLLFHLTSGGERNALYLHCTPDQRAAIAALLAHLVESRAALVDAHRAQDDLLRAWELWSAEG